VENQLFDGEFSTIVIKKGGAFAQRDAIESLLAVTALRSEGFRIHDSA
jgi:hypothetical protein